MTSDSIDLTSLIGRFQEYLSHDDVRYHFMKILHKQVTSKAQNSASDTVLTNIVILLEQISFPSSETGELDQMMSKYPGMFCDNKYSTVVTVVKQRLTAFLVR